jgi:uncharacterized membrane protein YphA (DoxX/SURF4 family)
VAGNPLYSGSSKLQDAPQPKAGIALFVMRVTLGAMFVSVFFENLGKGLYTPAGYAGLINNYIQHGTAPAIWKSVMAQAASHASTSAPLQAVFEIGIGIVLILGLFTRPLALIAFLYLSSLWISEWGIGWVWELLVPMMVAVALSIGSGGRTLGVDAFLAKRRPDSLLW